MRTIEDFTLELLKAKQHPDADYGGNVLPAGRIYSSTASHEEGSAFLGAIEALLRSEDIEVRRWAITVCIGFVVFRDAIAWPVLPRGN